MARLTVLPMATDLTDRPGAGQVLATETIPPQEWLCIGKTERLGGSGSQLHGWLEVN